MTDLMTPAEVARAFRVDPKTVTRWAHAGRIPSIRTPGGHRRFRATDVQAALRPDYDPMTYEREDDELIGVTVPAGVDGIAINGRGVR